MEMTLSGMTTSVREEHPQKAFQSIEVTPSGMTTSAKEEQSKKASCLIEVTLSGITISAREEQYWKVLSPIVRMLLPRLTKVSDRQSKKIPPYSNPSSQFQ